MSVLVRLYNFVGGTPAVADQVDDEYNQIINALNGTSTDKNLVTRYSHATDPPYAFDQLGAGLLAQWKQSGVEKARINNDGSFQTTSTTLAVNFNADLLDGFHQSSFVRDPGGNGLVSRTGAGSAVARTIFGTSNQVTVVNGDGVSGHPVISLPQDIHTGASPTFANLTLSGNETIGGTLQVNGASIVLGSLSSTLSIYAA
jgi:hypothetical protein